MKNDIKTWIIVYILQHKQNALVIFSPLTGSNMHGYGV